MVTISFQKHPVADNAHLCLVTYTGVHTRTCLSALRCAEVGTGREVCVKVIKNSKDFFDQSLDEIQLLECVNTV